MIFQTRVISTAKDKVGRLLVKIWRKSRSDVQERIQVSPHGIDSNPVKDMVAIYGQTSSDGKAVIIGYMLKNQIAKPGELRMFSTNAQGSEQTFIYLTDNGQILMGGNVDNLVKFTGLNQALQNQAIDINVQLSAIAAAITSLGGTYAPTPINININSAKADDMKTS